MPSDRLLLVLDLDETLVHTRDQPLERSADFRLADFHVYCRPHLQTFLDTVSGWYDLSVWTAGSTPYAHGIVSHIIAQPESLRFVWRGQRCTQRIDPEWGTFAWIKDLRKVKRCGFPLERILALDDSPEKLQRQYGNLVRVREFLGDPADTELLDLLPFLDMLKTCENVRIVEKRHWRSFAKT